MRLRTIPNCAGIVTRHETGIIVSRYCSGSAAAISFAVSMKTMLCALLLGVAYVRCTLNDRRRDHDDARSIQAGDVYTQDTWDWSWEGTLKRTNGNIGHDHHADQRVDLPSMASRTA